MYFLEGKLQIDAKNSNFEIFESALYMKSVSMPLSILIRNYFVALHKKKMVKKVIFCLFLKKFTFLVKFDAKNGFCSLFSFQIPNMTR